MIRQHRILGSEQSKARLLAVYKGTKYESKTYKRLLKKLKWA